MHNTSVEETWKFHDDLVRRWFNPNYERHLDADRRTSLQKSLQLPISPWLEHWLAFAESSFEHGGWYNLRDDVLIKRMDSSGIEAVSMLMQGEGDVFWCVKLADWGDENPAVSEFAEWPADDSVGEDGRLYESGTIAPFLAAFALGYQFLYLATDSLRCESLDSKVDEEWCEKKFGKPTQFGHLKIYENDDALFVTSDHPHYLWSLMYHGIIRR